MAQYLSADRAVNVNTDTPMLTSLAVSDILQISSPQGQDSSVYMTETNGTQMRITNRSASAKEKMYLTKKIVMN